MDATGAAPSSRTGRLPRIAKYDVLEEIGHGGMATVYRAHDRRLGRDVAIKVIHPHLRDSPEVAHRFSVEAQAVAKLRHPNIVEVYDVSGDGDAEQYLVCELLRGVTLRKLLQQHGAVPPEVGVALAIELLDALAHAHGAGVVHRDIKPENVILEHRPAPEGATDEPGRVVVKLTDFGIAKLLDAQGVTSTGQVLGSPAHMAPEQIEGGAVDVRADVFGMGVLLYECVVGHLPFEGNNPAQVLRRVLEGQYAPAEHENPIVGRVWSTILDRALAHSPDARFPDAVSMRDALTQELRRLGIEASHTELAAWYEDPAGYRARHASRMIARLCERAAEARKGGNVLAAAADYNRALAYAPNDPQLMKIVTSMHRAEAHGRIVRHATRAALAALVLGVLAFAVTRALQSRGAPDPIAPAPSALLVRPEPSAVPSAPSSPTASTTSAPATALVDAHVPAPVPLPGAASKGGGAGAIVARGGLRDVTVNTSPAYVRVSIDGAPGKELTSGSKLSLDEKPHALRFTCADPEQTMCDPTEVAVPAGGDPMTLPVVLHIRDATLVVRGGPNATYRVISKSLATIVASGVSTKIPMKGGGKETAQVVELPSGRQVTVILIAGRETTLDATRFQNPEGSE